LFLAMLRSETEGSPDRLASALAGLKAYQAAERVPVERPTMVAASAGRARLIDFGTAQGGRPLIFIPSLINGNEVLDLLPESSLMRWFADRGWRPLVVDWGTPTPEERDLDIGGHVETLLLPMIEAIGPDAALVGYCLGGTMATAAAVVRPPKSLTLIAAPWQFTAYPHATREGLFTLWEQAGPAAERIGLLPVEVLQTAFWRLQPDRTVNKFVALGGRLDDPEAVRQFVAVEDWANGGAPLTLAAGRDLIETMFREDATAKGRWRVAGRTIDPTSLRCPVLNIASSTDRIVPAASAADAGERMTLTEGHVGMIVGHRSETALRQPLADWLANAHMRS
jgi:polyhydroxyalkanoate synthase subunit PhaC